MTTSDSGNSFLLPVGCIDIIDGYETKLAHQTGDIHGQSLHYLLIITPAFQAFGEGSHDDFGEYVTSLSHAWNTEKGPLFAAITWNRQTDIVTIGKQDFIRAKGNVMVVRVNGNGGVSARHSGSLGPHVRDQAVLKYAKATLPDDASIGSVKLCRP